VPVWRLESVPVGDVMAGPAIVETATTTVVIDPGATFSRRQSGTLHIVPRSGESAAEGRGEPWTASAWQS
jgi:N-methylhydantoinase A